MAALEPNEANLTALMNVLRATIEGNNKTIKEATDQLTQLEARPQYSLCLLQLLAMPTLQDVSVKQASAIAFKNFILRCWSYEDSERQEKGQPDMIIPADRQLIKAHLIPLMVSQPKTIQTQLGHALAIISRHDFPKKWETLLPELVGRFKEADSKPEELLGVLEVMHSIFYRYRIELKSQALWEEIEIVLKQVCDPLSELFLRWVTRVSEPAHSNNPQTLPIIIGILSVIVENFYSLNSQEIAAQFEEQSTKQLWFRSMLELLKYTNPILEPQRGKGDIDDPTKLDTLKATICDIINLFVWKYEDQFAEFVPSYVETVWNLLTTLSGQKRFDPLVNSAVKFLTSVVKKEQFKHLFGNEAALHAICEKVIIPQLKLRESDIETFEFNPQDYIRMDIEGSDVDTRRRTAVDFIHGLTMHYEAQISTILKGYVTNMLKEYETKQSTSKGVIETNPHVDLLEFFSSQVIPDLLSGENDSHAILKADCLKYVSIFRQQLAKEHYVQLLPVMVRYLASENMVIHTYASYAIERMLSVKESNGSLRLDKAAIQSHLLPLLNGLFSALNHDESKENEYLMRAIMRVCSVGQDAMVPFASTIIGKVTQILSYVAQNPKNPKFNHCLFETIAALAKYICQSNGALVDSFESALFPPFKSMLQMESAAEFTPYVFQILAQLLELRPDASGYSQEFINFFPNILLPALWLNQGNVPALTRFLQAYLRKPTCWSTFFNGNNRFMGVLGIFQELLRLRATEAYALDIVTSVIVDLDLAHTSSSLLIVFRDFLFPRLQADKKPTPRLFAKTLVLFLAFLSKHGFERVKAMLDQIQVGVFGGFFGGVILGKADFLVAEAERRLGAIVLTTIATHPAFLNDPTFANQWARTVLCAAKLVAPKQSKAVAGAGIAGATAVVGDDDDADDLLSQSDKGFSTAYARLVFATVPDRDFAPQTTIAPKEFVKQQISAIIAQHGQKLTGLLSSLPQSDQAIINAALTQ